MDGEIAYCTVATTEGSTTYLLRPGNDPAVIGSGELVAVSTSGNRLISRTTGDTGPWQHSLHTISVHDGSVTESTNLGGLFEAVLTGNGRTIYQIDAGMRLARMTPGSDGLDYLSSGDDLKKNLTVSEDGSAIAFVSDRNGDFAVILGRTDPNGEFRLASVTDQTGFYSSSFSLSGDGYHLLAYGSRTELAGLVKAAGEALKVETLAADEIAAVDAEDLVEDSDTLPQPARRRERFGVIRIDLSGSPDEWSITSVNPRFISESTAEFDSAGTLNQR